MNTIRSSSSPTRGGRLLAATMLCAAPFACTPSPTGGDPDLLTPAPDGGNDPGADLRPPGDGPIFDDLVSGVEVLRATGPYNAFARAYASFYKAGAAGFHREVMRKGACRLLTFKPAFCDNPCQGICVDTNQCRPFPERVSAGNLTLSGLKVAVTLRPDAQNYYYNQGVLPADLFAEGAALGVSASGGTVPAFSLTTRGVAAPLASASIVNHEITLKDGADYAFSWTPGADPDARVRVTLNANNRGHGMPYEGIIECDAPDAAGAVTIDKDLITAFPQTFRWEICAGRDCPLSSARRYRRAATGGGVTFSAVAERLFFVLHNPPQR